MNELGAGASPGPVGGPTPSLPRSEVPSSRSSMVDSASEMSESDTDAMSLSGKTCKQHQATSWNHYFFLFFLGFSEHSNRHSRQRVQVEELTARVSTLTQENRVLKVCYRGVPH